MTRKTLSVLVLAPVLFFAIDKTVIPDGGGKEKKAKKEHSQEQVSVAGAAAEYGATTKEGTEAIRARKVKAIKSMIAYLASDGGRQEYYDASTVWYAGDDVPKKEVELLEAAIKTMEKSNVEQITIRSFSRCPSGYSVIALNSEEGTRTRTGYLMFASGCDEVPLGVYRYDESAKVLEVKVSDAEGYVSLDEYLSLYKEAKG